MTTLRTIAISIATYLLMTVLLVLLAPGLLSSLESKQPQEGVLLPVSENIEENQSQRVVDLVEISNPAVVSVVVTAEVATRQNRLPRLFEEFFGRPLERPETEVQERQVAGGSGFIVSNDGLIVTNRHVIDVEGASYTVLMNDGEELPASLVARDPFFDIAILQIEEASQFPHLEFGDSSDLKLGESVVAIGNALGEFRNSVSLGVVSGLSRDIQARASGGRTESLEEVIQTDAAINPGNSGGPLLDINGDVIGVNVAVALGSENIGFALPSNVVKEIVDSVKETGQIVRPYLGVRYVQVDPIIARQNNLTVDYGALLVAGEAGVPAVVPGSPAQEAGLSRGDIILSFNGQSINEDTSLATLIRDVEVGDLVTLEVLKPTGDIQQTSVTLEEAPDTM